MRGGGFATAAAGGGFEFTGFVDDARKFFDDAVGGDFLRFFEVNEGDVGATEEFFHISRVAARIVFVGFGAVVEFDSADGAKGALVTEDEIDGFVFDKAFGLVAILETNFVAEERGKVDARDDVELFAKEVV